MSVRKEARKYFIGRHRVTSSWVTRHCTKAGEDLKDIASVIRFSLYCDALVGFYKELVSADEVLWFLSSLGIPPRRAEYFLRGLSCRYGVDGEFYYDREYVVEIINMKFSLGVSNERFLTFLRVPRRFSEGTEAIY